MQRGVGRFWRALEFATAGLLLAMMALVFPNVVLRYGFSSGLRPAIELSRLSFVWIRPVRGHGGPAPGRASGRRGVRADLPAAPAAGAPACDLAGDPRLDVHDGRRRLAPDPGRPGGHSPLTGLPTGLTYVPGVLAGGLMVAVAIVRLIDPSPRRGDE